ncbi:hypothetical protein LC612_27195 [Nostoc sp. CHAB 5834]|nr:hypothetical protein [Nostoc sp. CHAB 5834]
MRAVIGIRSLFLITFIDDFDKLTDDNGTRPLKTRAEFANLPAKVDKQLDLVLEILVASKLVLLLPESPTDFLELS